MNSFSDLSQKLAQSKPIAACASALAEGNFPLEIQGTEGAFTAMLLARLFTARPGIFFVVVPQETDAADLALDLAASGLPCLQFPWWPPRKRSGVGGG